MNNGKTYLPSPSCFVKGVLEFCLKMHLETPQIICPIEVHVLRIIGITREGV